MLDDRTFYNVAEELRKAVSARTETFWSRMDLFTVEVLTLKGLLTYYVLFFIHLETRRVSLAGFTPYPDQQWMEQQARNMTMEQWGRLRGCRYLLHDRDRKFCQSFRELIESGNVKPIRLPARSPKSGTIRAKRTRSCFLCGREGARRKMGAIQCGERPGGLLKYYEWQAA